MIFDIINPCAQTYAVHVPLHGYMQQYKKNTFRPSQNVCYKSYLKVLFKLCRPFKHHFWTTLIAYLLGRSKAIEIALGAYCSVGGHGQHYCAQTVFRANSMRGRSKPLNQDWQRTVLTQHEKAMRYPKQALWPECLLCKASNTRY